MNNDYKPKEKEYNELKHQINNMQQNYFRDIKEQEN